MMNGVLDSDAHVQEPEDLWDNYLDRAYWERKPRITTRGDGKIMIVYGDFQVSIFTPPSQRGPDRDIRIRLRDMDLEGIQVAVLFPSKCLGVNQPSDPG